LRYFLLGLRPDLELAIWCAVVVDTYDHASPVRLASERRNRLYRSTDLARGLLELDALTFAKCNPSKDLGLGKDRFRHSFRIGHTASDIGAAF
jgi:hypothetical protein